MSRRRIGTRLAIGGAMLLAFVAVGVVGPWLAPSDPARIDLAARFSPMSAAHWLGTDSTGVDTLTQLLAGARSALVVSGFVVAITAALGSALGLVAGWFGGWVDELIMRAVDILMAFPGLLLNIAIVATVAHPGLALTIAALCANGWVGYARVVRAQVLALREREFVSAAIALGAAPARVIVRHLAPNTVAPIVIQASFAIASVIMVEASLSFLGLGPQTDATWGAMLEQGTAFLWRDGFLHYPLAPGFAILWVVIGANLTGDALRDRLDPRGAR